MAGFRLGGTSFPILAPDGSAAAPSYSFFNDPDTGFHRPGSNIIDVDLGATSYMRFGINSLKFPSTTVLGWSSGSVSEAVDTSISRVSAGVFGLTGPLGTINVTAGASGLATFGASVVATGNVFATDFIAGQGNNIYWNGRVILSSPSTGSIRIRNNALTNSVDLTVGASNLLTANGPIKTASYTVGTLPAAGTVGGGTTAYVTDALTPTFGSAAVGGGAVGTVVFSNNSTWIVG